jgi:hypothetical protein
VPRPRPTPSTQDQRSDGRGQMTDHPCRPPLRDPGPVREHRPAAAHGSGSHALPMLAHRQRIPMPRPDLTPPPKRRAMMAGPASRSRLASRFHKNRGQRPEDRPDAAA